jgi:hypothetical protein
MRRVYIILSGKLERKDHFQDLGSDEELLLKFITRNRKGGLGPDSSGSR